MEAILPKMTSTDRFWERLARENPYYTVLSDPKFLAASLNDESFQEFFSSGESHIQHVFTKIREKIKPDFEPARVLDYGCGVGRLLIPLARRSREVVGVDVSPSMLAHARDNCERYALHPVRLLHADDLSSLASASFDLVHSFIVFQHIPVARGERILSRLIALIANGGLGALHFTFRDIGTPFERNLLNLRQRIPLVHGIINLARGRQFDHGIGGLMNCYSMSRIFEILVNSGCSNLHVELSSPSRILGAMLYFEKASKAL
jgi:SAM-dependent methyltransferase